jgi:glucose dehydrogenase
VLFDFHGIPAIAHTNKAGFTFILDRRTGKALIPYRDVPVPMVPTAQEAPSPTQPESLVESLTEHKVRNPPPPLPAGWTAAAQWTTPQETTQFIFQPLFDGGMEWPPAAYSPRTHLLYSHARYLPEGLVADPTFQNNLGVLFGPHLPGHGVYGAVDTLSGKVAWKNAVTPQPNSGMGVAGDLVFFGESTGLFHAADARTGEILWTFNSSTVPHAGGANASPAIYVVNGREYVAYGFGGNPGESPVLGDAVIAFAIPEGD